MDSVVGQRRGRKVVLDFLDVALDRTARLKGQGTSLGAWLGSKDASRPMVLSIVGSEGTGKTSMSQAVTEVLCGHPCRHLIIGAALMNGMTMGSLVGVGANQAGFKPELNTEVLAPASLRRLAPHATDPLVIVYDAPELADVEQRFSRS